jgi:LysR family transcriptional regulator, transcriptional activator of the cysJI operon
MLDARFRTFAAVARNGSFSRAAAELHVSQPAVSKHVAALEAELGTSLVIRGRRGTTLTPAGDQLADFVLRAEALLANGRRAVEAEREGRIGALALVASGIPGTYLLPPLIARFHAENPGVEISFQLSTSAGALDFVRAHRAELGVIGGLLVPPELESETLVEDEIVLVGPPSLGGRRLSPLELSEHAWVYREEGSATRAAVEAARWEAGLHVGRSLELPSWEAVKLVVSRGEGIAAISRFALDVELRAGTLVVLDVPRWRVKRLIAAVRAREIPLGEAAGDFVQLLRSELASSTRP